MPPDRRALAHQQFPDVGGRVPTLAQNGHEAHHPKPADSSATVSGTSMGGMAPTGKPGGMGGMKEGMGEMMGKLPPRELYPTLMQVPLDPAQREEARRLAEERIN